MCIVRTIKSRRRKKIKNKKKDSSMTSQDSRTQASTRVKPALLAATVEPSVPKRGKTPLSKAVRRQR